MKLRLTAAALSLLVVTVPALAQHEHHDAKPAEQPAAAMPGMDPAAMAAMEAAGKPGPQHQHLAKMAGDWTYDITLWMAPGAPPMKSNGTMHGEMMMDGRYLHEVWKGDMMGAPFEGHSTEGYDNVAKHWFGTWMDNMSTGMMTSTGTCNEAMDSCTYSSEMYDPMSGQKTTSRTVITWLDANSFKNQAYTAGPDGKEFQTMEIVAKRK
ncbi:MAG TPA: DUF1579 domain-containing protein [Thermoanaerobaculia bacterium]|jgi:hypothetical protein|nr:DUF1579 domain-containing protein [Thermoanaerobaculia bacterium]